MNPRRLVFGATLLLLGASWAGAACARPALGVELGLNHSELTYRSSTFDWQPKLRPAWSAGLSAEIPLGAQISLRTGARYLEYGDVMEFTFTSVDMSGSVRWHQVWRYAGVPLLLRLRPARAPGFFVELGPEPMVLLRAVLHRASTIRGGYDPNPNPRFSTGANIFDGVGPLPAEEDVTSGYRRWGLAAEAGIGYDRPWAGHRVGIEARYAEGLVDVQRTSDPRRHVRGLEALVGLGW